MKKGFKEWILAFFVGLVIPWLVFSVVDKIYLSKNPIRDTNQTEEVEEGTIDAFGALSESILVLRANGSTEIMDMDNYLTGVVLGEMPADFHEEALKAQAVVARTYALKRFTTGQKHPQGAVCTQSSCCQAYRTPESFIESGGTQINLEKVFSAVKSTSGQVLFYDGVLIEATYFSCSGGRTEDALAVWGSDIPYLQAVDSPGEEGAAYYTDSVKFTADDFFALLEIEQEGPPASWLGEVTYTDGGGVAEMWIGGKKFEGTALREKLGLRSTAFVMTAVGDTVYITTRGFGHRVGMSQYGAEAMAVNGSSYQEILSHYYPGTELRMYSYN